MAADEAGEDGRSERSYIGVDEEGLVVGHGGCELHHLIEDECIVERMCDFLCDELYKVGNELVETRI